VHLDELDGADAGLSGLGVYSAERVDIWRGGSSGRDVSDAQMRAEPIRVLGDSVGAERIGDGGRARTWQEVAQSAEGLLAPVLRILTDRLRH
jgi:hypothetical protein